jgi:arginine-tRNA-protein transferase
VLYRNRCAACDACVPIRVDAAALEATKGQRRAIRANADVTVSLEERAFSAEDYALMKRYLLARHPEEAAALGEEEYRKAYVESPVAGAIARYRTADGRLVAAGYLDLLPDGLSSVYFAFDPDESRRSLGVFSVFAESRIARELGKRWYYLGFWVAGCRKMAYKAGFRPHEIARGGVWLAPREEGA